MNGVWARRTVAARRRCARMLAEAAECGRRAGGRAGDGAGGVACRGLAVDRAAARDRPGGAAMQRAVHAATAMLPHLRRGLTAESAAGRRRPCACSPAPRRSRSRGSTAARVRRPGPDHHRAGDPLERLIRAHATSACTWSRACAGAPGLPAALGDRRAAGGAGAPDRHARRALRAPGRCGWRSRAWSPRRPRSSPRWSSWRRSRRRASGWPAPSCGRCGRRSRRTSSTTRSPPSRRSSTRARRRRASC